MCTGLSPGRGLLNRKIIMKIIEPVQQLRGEIIKENKLTKKNYVQIGITSFVKCPLKTRYHKTLILYVSSKTSSSL